MTTSSSSSTIGYLTHMVVSHLSPMFRATTGDHDQANSAAIETVRACLTDNPADLFLIGQMIALGLGALSSVSLSMAENLPINAILRLRGNAIGQSRASQQCRRALPDADPAGSRPDAPFSDGELAEQDRIIAELSAQKGAEPARAPLPEVASAEDDPDFPLPFPESFDAMKAAMARIVTISEHRTGEPEAAAKDTPHGAPLGGAPFDSDKILRASLLVAFPDDPPEVIEELLKQQTEPPAGALGAAALCTTANHLVAGAQPPQP